MEIVKMKTSIKKTASGKIHVKGARLAFPVLNEPEAMEGGAPRFGASLLVDKDVNAALQAEMKAVAIAKWGAKGEAIYKNLVATLKVALRDGDTKEYDGFADKDFISAASPAASPPGLFDSYGDANGKPVVLPRDTTRLYPGCYVNATITFWAQDHAKHGKRINATLNGVQFAADGDSFSAARASTADDFDAVEPADLGDDLA